MSSKMLRVRENCLRFTLTFKNSLAKFSLNSITETHVFTSQYIHTQLHLSIY